MHTINHNVKIHTTRRPTIISILHSSHFIFLLLLAFITTLVHSAGSPVPGPRTKHCAVTWTDPTGITYLYVYGGTGDPNSSPFSRIQLPLSSPQSTSSWTSLSQDKMLVLSEAACIVSPDNRFLLVIGGTLADGTVPTTRPFPLSLGIQAFDLRHNVWIAAPIIDSLTDAVGPLLNGRTGSVAASYITDGAKRVVVYGGSHPNGTDNSRPRTFILSMDSDARWTWVPRFYDSLTPPAVQYPGITMLDNNKILLIGGQQLNNQGIPVASVTDIYTFDAAALRWEGKSDKSLKAPVCDTCQIAVGNGNQIYLYVIPGVSSTNSSALNIQVLSSKKQSVILNSTDADSIYGPKSATFAYAALKDVMYIHGTSATINNIVQFNLTSGTWIQDSSSLVSNNSTSQPTSTNLPAPTASASKSSSTLPIIVGCLIGVLGLFGLIALFMYRRRLKEKSGSGYVNRKVSDDMTDNLVDDQASVSANPKDFLSNLMRRLSSFKTVSVQLVDEERSDKRQSSELGE
ncbi:3568_t:CDS:1 [Paraglomus brasilianum]|uniref:3568_t:CDS:1 n=1 Tax=Paraglomus brasilianum TaxID=144538 RepID=A0A9N9CXD7_9GLOM|nr:3568_t:CDS:1 [Paraglomus brasilianum]